MVVLGLVTGVSLVLAIVAWSKARRTARRLAQLSEMCWELKYQHGELRAQMNRLVGSSAEPGQGRTAPTPTPSALPTEAFVPLATLKR
jgi:hypothetical protein